MTEGWIRSWASFVAVVAFCLAFLAPPSFAAPPPNDDFAGAQTLSGTFPIEASGTNIGATLQGGEPTQAWAVPGGHSVWFRWDPTETEVVTVTVCGQMAPLIGVYLGGGVGVLTEVVANSDEYAEVPTNCEYPNRRSATFKAIAGQSYSIQVDGNTYHSSSEPAPSGEGSIRLSILHQPPPANDDFDDAEPVQLDHGLISASNFGATKQPGEPDHGGDPGGASVWYQFTAPRTGGVALRLNGRGATDNVIGVYTGTSVGSLTAVPTTELQLPGEYVFRVDAGVTYRIAVDGRLSAATGSPVMDETQMQLLTYPPNDDFENPIPLMEAAPLGFGSTSGSLGNVGATMQPGEPNPGGLGGASVWFTWTAPESGSLYLSTCSASFRTILTVYTGSSLPGLTPVASSDDPQTFPCTVLGPPAGSPQVALNVGGGTRYTIAVDGYAGAWGRFGIQMQTSKKLIASSAVAAVAAVPRVPLRPQTKIARAHVNRTRGFAVFTLRSSQSQSTFRCKLDQRPFKACSSTVAYHRLRSGRHIFKFKAVNSFGEADRSAAIFRFALRKSRR